MLSKVIFILSMLVVSNQVAAQVLQDPTRPGQPAQTLEPHARQADSFRLDAVFYSQQSRRAVINNALVSVDDHVGGARVLAILPNSVRLEVISPQGPESVTVKLESATVTRRTSEEF